MRKIIFLDVDGVLNNDETEEKTPSGFVGVSEDLIERLGRIVREQKAEVVLSSSWRLSDENPTESEKTDYLYLEEKLASVGVAISGSTPNVRASRRGQEIREYLDSLEEDVGWVVLDDIFFPDFESFGITERLVITDGEEGLTDDDAAAAAEILNGGIRNEEGRHAQDF